MSDKKKHAAPAVYYKAKAAIYAWVEALHDEESLATLDALRARHFEALDALAESYRNEQEALRASLATMEAEAEHQAMDRLAHVSAEELRGVSHLDRLKQRYYQEALQKTEYATLKEELSRFERLEADTNGTRQVHAYWSNEALLYQLGSALRGLEDAFRDNDIQRQVSIYSGIGLDTRLEKGLLPAIRKLLESVAPMEPRRAEAVANMKEYLYAQWHERLVDGEVNPNLVWVAYQAGVSLLTAATFTGAGVMMLPDAPLLGGLFGFMAVLISFLGAHQGDKTTIPHPHDVVHPDSIGDFIKWPVNTVSVFWWGLMMAQAGLRHDAREALLFFQELASPYAPEKVDADYRCFASLAPQFEKMPQQDVEALIREQEIASPAIQAFREGLGLALPEANDNRASRLVLGEATERLAGEENAPRGKTRRS